MLNFAIVDDEPQAVRTLETFIRRYCLERGLGFNVYNFNNSIRFLEGYKPEYDIVFLDIDMPGMTGMELARNLRKTDSEVALVFVTNMAQYAIRGYEVDADDFIVKPVRYGNLEIKLGRILRKHSKKDEVRLSVYENGVIKYVPLADVRYVEVVKHSIIYHMSDGSKHEKRGSLKKEEELFTKNGFAQCNKSCIVNLKFVLGITGYDLHVAKHRGSSDYEELTISHPRKQTFVHTLNEFLEHHL